MTEWLHKLIEQTKSQINNKAAWLDGSSPIFIYGTGSVAQDIYRVLTNHGVSILGFLDHIERDMPFLSGVPTFKPEKAKLVCQQGKEPVVILGINNKHANTSEIINTLNQNGIHRIISLIELYDTFGKDLGIRYWLTSRDFYTSSEPILNELFELWSDNTSKSLFRAILEHRLSGDSSKLPKPDITSTYHPQDIPSWEKPLRFIDCGAYVGDTLVDLLNNHFNFESVMAFEPDQTNFNQLTNFVHSNLELVSNISLWPCGVFSSTTQLSFESGKATSSNISENGENIIQCISLDDVLPTYKPNLIKMDVEGAEYDALLGARRLISTFTPGLAIALYHRPEHLWQIPFLVDRIAPRSYEFFMRSHANNDFELFMYAIPRRRS